MTSYPRVMIFPITMTCNSKCRSCGIWRLPDTAKEHSGADLLTRVAGRDLAVMEVECRSRRDGQCRFLLGSPDTLGAVYEGLREGRSYLEVLDRLA